MFAALPNILIERHSTRSGVHDWSTPRHLRRQRTEDGRCSLRVMDPCFHGPDPGLRNRQKERKKERERASDKLKRKR